MSAPHRILIIRLSSLGDILHTLPAFADLRAAFPDARLDWLVAKNCSSLLSATSGIHSIHVLDTNALLRSPSGTSVQPALWSLIGDLRRQHYDISIDFQGLIKTAVLGSLSGARTRFGFSRKLAREFPAHWFYHQTLAKPESQIHVLQLNRMLAGLTGATPITVLPELRASDEDSQYVESLLKQEGLTDFVVVNPGGGWPTKRWSLERFGVLAQKITTEMDFPVVVTTGPGEEAYYKTIVEHGGSSRIHHFPVPFLQLIPLFKKAHLIIGGDTGPFHLACALGKAVVGIFGPTSPIRNGPWGDKDDIVVHALPCSYCYGRKCPTNMECMDISVEEVFTAVIRRLERTESSSNARF